MVQRSGEAGPRIRTARNRPTSHSSQPNKEPMSSVSGIITVVVIVFSLYMYIGFKNAGKRPPPSAPAVDREEELEHLPPKTP